MNRTGMLLAAGAALAAAVLAGCASVAPASTGRAGGAPAVGSSSSPTRTHTTHARTTDSAAHTSHRVFAAFGPSGAPTTGVMAHRSGSCFTASITVADRSAYRCLASAHSGSTLLDPCFVVPSSHRRLVDCYADPWSAATRLRLTHVLPRHLAPLKITDPWALRLADGTRCTVTTGTAAIVRGVPLRYSCGPAVEAGISRAAGQPTMAEVRRNVHGTVAVRQVAVAGTWSA